MTQQRLWLIILVTAITFTAGAVTGKAQVYGDPLAAPPAAMMQGFNPMGMPPAMGPLPPPGFGDPMMMGGIMPANYGGAPITQVPFEPSYDMVGSPSCSTCSGVGCDACGLKGNFRTHFLSMLLPYGEGGCCAQRNYDIAVDLLHLKRIDNSNSIGITSQGPRGFGPPNIVLSTGSTSFDSEFAMKFSISRQIHAGYNIEGTYFGLNNWASAVSVSDPNDNLFSVFSDFGTVPPPQAGVDSDADLLFDNPPQSRGGFPDTDSAEFHGLEESSNFHSTELNIRHRWVAPNCRWQGSWLLGVRYFLLEEDLRHNTRVNYVLPQNNAPFDVITGGLDYNINTYNSMTGAQAGFDAWACIVPGVRVGIEAKAGIYGNRSTNSTSFVGQNAGATVFEVSETDAAFLGEVNLLHTWRVNYNWTIRGGYQLMWVEGIALAADQFDTVPPALGGLNPRLDSDAGLFYHGGLFALEWMW